MDTVDPREETYVSITQSKMSEYLRWIRHAESTLEKAVLVTTFFKFLLGIPRFLARNPSIVAPLKVIIEDHKNEFKNVPNAEIAASFQQYLSDITYVLADEKDAKVMYYGNM